RSMFNVDRWTLNLRPPSCLFQSPPHLPKISFPMPTNVEIPALGESVQEAVLLKWHKNDGDAVTKDEPLCELETDKANVDVPSPAAGVLRRVKDEGATVHIGETIARIDEGGKAASGNGSPQPAKNVTAEAPRITAAAPQPAA